MTYVSSRLARTIVLLLFVFGFLTFPYSAGKHIYLSPDYALIIQISMIALFALNLRVSVIRFAIYLLLASGVVFYIGYFNSDASFHILDAAMAFSPLVYLILISGGWTKSVPKSLSLNISKFIFLAMPVFYFIRLIGGVSEPGFFLENNLELIIFVSSAFVVFGSYFKKPSLGVTIIFWFLIVFVLFLVDAKGHLIAVIAAISTLHGLKKYSLLFILCLSPFVLSTLTELWLVSDRFYFLSVFLYSFDLWPRAGFALDTDTCKLLSHAVAGMYDRMGYCSSAMFHGSVPRMLYDFGLVFGSAICILFFLVIRQITPRLALPIYVYFFVSGVFISIFGSSLFLLSIFLLRGVSYDNRSY
jgi:hypothetical protein